MRALFDTALAELGAVAERIDERAITRACETIAAARRIVLYGCGREGLQMRGFAMRLHHLGCDVAMQGDMAAPPVGPGDLFIASAGPGELATVTALMRIAREAGADVPIGGHGRRFRLASARRSWRNTSRFARGVATTSGCVRSTRRRPPRSRSTRTRSTTTATAAVPLGTCSPS